MIHSKVPFWFVFFSAPLAMVDCADADEILVSGFASNEVHRFDFDTGDYLGALDLITNPQAICFGLDGHLYVAAEGEDRILRYDGVTLAPLGEFIADDPLTPEDETGGLNAPTGILFDDLGDAYVASFNTDAILKYSGVDGSFLEVFVSSGSGGLNGPDAGIAFGPDGALYVPSFFTDEILRYDGTTGEFLDEFVSAGVGGLNEPRAVVFRSDGLAYVSSQGSNAILRFDLAGNLVDEFITFNEVTGFRIASSDGNVYATSVTRNNVRRFDGTTGERDGAAVSEGEGGLDTAVAMALWPDPQLRLSRFLPGRVGEINQIFVRNAEPNSVLFLFLGGTATSVRLSPCPHAYLGVGGATLVVLSADGNGEWLAELTPDPGLQGVFLALQVVEVNSCRLSNLVLQTLE